MGFKQVTSQVNFPELERTISEYWEKNDVVKKYLNRNSQSKKKFSFLDGPITANNPMGVHHAWGRTYKDLWQRYFTLKGYAGRYQNGFDCQGLWVEVEVEKELGFKTKKDIETYGVAEFVQRCKDRVIKFSSIQTQQSQRLGYFMDWENSYFTMSDQNNYSIWSFIKKCHDKGWLYKGNDSVPWCPRCETAISQHEILTEDYKEITHDSIYIAFPVSETPGVNLLVWTTTPWTLPANIAIAVDTKIEYSLVLAKNGQKYWLATESIERVMGNKMNKILKKVKGGKLVGLKYATPFDHLPLISKSIQEHQNIHVVVATDEKIMPITTTEGTGMVHTAVSAGEEDFKLGAKLKLPMIPVILDNADYIEGLGEFTGKNAKKNPKIILDYLNQKNETGEHWVFEIMPYLHRYPACWRCKTELVWKVADEWYISMDKADPNDSKKRTFRKQMIDLAKKINWIPAFGKDRELDWLENMHDWLISKKNRYWGLALPIYECKQCRKVQVVGSKEELEKKAIAGWDKFNGHSPHKPFIDEVKIKCESCSNLTSRISDVGNPWLDAGIVGVSTLPEGWYPADFITESFPGQFKNWFYSLIAMSTVMKNTIPFKNVLGFASLLGEDGRPMHKSWGNSIEFNEGADKIGVDVMRWVFMSQNPEQNLIFGFKKTDDTRRRFHLILWNIYNFFVNNANYDKFNPTNNDNLNSSNILDQWILLRLNNTLSSVEDCLDKFQAHIATRYIEDFVEDFSTWYIRRSRSRVGPSATNKIDKQFCYQTIYTCLITISKLLAPFTPYLSEEIYTNLTSDISVHLSDWPTRLELKFEPNSVIENMKLVRKYVESGLSLRKDNSIKVRQPLKEFRIYSLQNKLPADYLNLILEELNIKTITWTKSKKDFVEFDFELSPELLAEGINRDLIRDIQEARKSAGARMDQYIKLIAPLPNDEKLLNEIRKKTLAKELENGESISVELL